jgi:uncharacterized protein (TIGR03435 family)
VKFTDHDLKDLIDRHLKWPSDLSFTAARDRVREQLLATPASLQTARVADLPSSIPMWRMAAAAAVVVIAVIGTAIFWPRGVQAYSAGDGGLEVTLADHSSVEMRAHSEMTVGRTADGILIDLKRGDIIVSAATQRDGHLYVQTRDMTVSVVGTVFLVNADEDGSRVGVIEGEVRVRERGTAWSRSGRQGGRETRLRPGEQVATSSAIVARPLAENINWSRNATAHLAILDSSTKATAQPAQSTAPITPPEQAIAANGVANSQAAKTEFEEASIRECDSGPPPPGVRGAGPGRFQMTPGRTFAECLTLATIIRTAYGGGLQDGALMPPRGVPIPVAARGGRLDPRSFAGASAMSFGAAYLGVEDGARVRGGPDWVRSTLYTIEAVATGAADAQTMRGPMLRALLERRFGLKVHVETEQFQVPQLAVAPGGLKMKEATCTISGPAPAPPPGDRAAAAAMAARRNLDVVRQNLDAARRGAPISGLCGIAGAMNGPNQVIVMNGFGAREIVVFLSSNLLGTALINRTGIPDTASFSFVLEFVPDDSLGREFLDQVTSGDKQIASDPSTVPRAPGFATALEEQLGLRLEPVRVPREFIVIDHVERPSPN